VPEAEQARNQRQGVAAKPFGIGCVFRGKPNSIPGQVEQDSGLKPNSIPG